MDSVSLHVDRSTYNGIMITHDDLASARDSHSAGSSLYVKPLEHPSTPSVINASCAPNLSPFENQNLQRSRENASEPQLFTMIAASSANRMRSVGIDSRRAADSPSANRIHRNAFIRNTALRRSLGGVAEPPSWPPYVPDRGNDTVGFDLELVSPELMGSLSGLTEHSLPPTMHVRVSRLPSLDDLGFTLDSFTHPQTGNFIGLRLLDRFRSRQLHFHARDTCPFLPGDIIVTVNQHNLSSMHESQAIRYVYNAFRDARQYTVEFGLHRFSDNPTKEMSETPNIDEVSTLPGRVTNRNRLSELFLPTSHTNNAFWDQHRPRRDTQPSPSSRTVHCANLRSTRTEGFSLPASSKSTAFDGLMTAADRSTLRTYSSSRGFVRPPNSHASGEFRASLTLDRFSIARNSQQRLDGVRSPATSSPVGHGLSASGTTKNLNVFNTRAIGQKVSIDLVKMEDVGFGFTLTSRDTQVGTESDDPVYVKSILSSGAAIVDGRLLVGDRLLTVDGMAVRNLEQVLTQLRQINPGDSVRLVISRHNTSTSDEPVERKSAGSTPSAPSLGLPPRPYRSFTFEFQLPTCTTTTSSPPTLGVNFKWALQPPDMDNGYADSPGLYVDSLVPNGLVAQIGRPTMLRGDRLVGLNGETLEGLSARSISTRFKCVLAANAEAMSPSSDGSETHRKFSVTVHRYRGFEQQSCVCDNSFQGIYVSPSTGRDGLPAVVNSRRNLSRRGSVIKRPNDNNSNFTHAYEDAANQPSSDVRFSSVPPRLVAISSFDRESFGRRSMSEKRHGNVDAMQLPFFQTNILPNRYKMPEDVDKQYSTMPTARRLKLHKERLSVAPVALSTNGPMKALHPSELNSEESNNHVRRTSDVKPHRRSHRGDDLQVYMENQSLFPRGRKQNSSFRNAVDRSFTLSTPIKHTNCPNMQVDFPSAASPHYDHAHSTDFPPNSKSLIGDAPSALCTPSSYYSPVRKKVLTDGDSQSSNILLTNPTTQQPPPLPPRLDTQTPVNHPLTSRSAKQLFGSLRGLFRRSDKKSTRTETIVPVSTCERQPLVHHRLSVPFNQFHDKSLDHHHHREMSLSNRTDDRLTTPKATPRKQCVVKDIRNNSVASPSCESQMSNGVVHKRSDYPSFVYNGDVMDRIFEWHSQIPRSLPSSPPPIPPRAHQFHLSQPGHPKVFTQPVNSHSASHEQASVREVYSISNRSASSARTADDSSKPRKKSSHHRSPVYIPKQSTRPSFDKQSSKAFVPTVHHRTTPKQPKDSQSPFYPHLRRVADPLKSEHDRGFCPGQSRTSNQVARTKLQSPRSQQAVHQVDREDATQRLPMSFKHKPQHQNTPTSSAYHLTHTTIVDPGPHLTLSNPDSTKRSRSRPVDAISSRPKHSSKTTSAISPSDTPKERRHIRDSTETHVSRGNKHKAAVIRTLP